MSSPIKQPKLLNYKNLNIDKYEYLLPHKTQNGYYQSICNYRLNKNQTLPFYFETPKLKTTSGIVKIDNKYYMDFELSQSGDIGLFHDFILKNDDNNISVCHTNSKEWFNQVMPLNIVENYYKSPIIKKPNGQLPIFRVRLPSYKGNILTEIFNIRKEKVQDINCIQEEDYLIGILEFSGLMFMSQNFTPCYELHKIKLFKDNDTRLLTSGYIFSDMNEKVDLDNKNNIKTDNILEDPIVNIEYDKSQAINKASYQELQNLIHKEKNIIESIVPSLEKSNNKRKTLFEMVKETSLKDFLIDEKLFINNNKLFNSNNNNNNNQVKKVNIDNKVVNIDNKIVNIDNKIVNIDDKIDEEVYKNNFKKINTQTIVPLKIEIQDIDNINLDIDYNLDSPSSSDDLLDEQSDIIDILNNYDISEFENNNKEEEEDEDEDEDEQEQEENLNDEENIEENLNDEENIEENLNDEENIEEQEEQEEELNDEENIEEEENIEDEENIEEEENIEDDDDIDYETLNDLEVIEFDE
jgi:hypothetical protein